MSTNWTPWAILPNLTAKKAIEGDIIAFAPCNDSRVVAFGAAHPRFGELISRFTDAFKVPLRPLVLIVRDDAIPKIPDIRPLASFRDLVALCAVPYGRSLASIYPNGGLRLSYANSFWLYPWTLGKDNESLSAATPALLGYHIVKDFRGQSSPELPIKELTDFDEPLFKALLKRWRQHYFGKHPTWRDRVLFRSLNMATHAAQLPAGMDVTLYDLGRMAALWVSAFEILSHPHKSNAGLRTVYPLLERVSYLNPKVGRRRFVAYIPGKNPWPRCPLPCWLYGKLYQARCDFLHGNPVSPKTLNPSDLEESLFWFAPGLYRLALTGFLGSSLKMKIPKNNDLKKAARYVRFTEIQGTIERALLQARKKIT